MDPDVALSDLRTQAAAVTDLVDLGERVAPGLAAMAERFRALDNWISKGGFLPRPWQERTHG